MRLREGAALERDERGRYLCPRCSWPFPSALSAATCDCDD